MSSSFDLRTYIIKIIFTLVACAFLVQIVHLQITGPNEDILLYWEDVSAGNEQQVPPTRGLIYDRNGNLLASNYTMYTVKISPDQIEGRKNTDTVASTLSRILDMPYDTVYDIAYTPPEKTPLKNSPVATLVEQEKIDQIAFAKDEFSHQSGTKKNPAPSLYGVYWEPFLIRNYPEGDLAANILGPIKKNGQALYGVEKQYDELLAGTPGKTLVTGQPNVVNEGDRPEGASLILTIDRELQRTVQEILTRHVDQTQSLSGTIIVSNPETGDILAMATDTRGKENLPESDSRIAFPNPAVQDLYEPGSVSKVLTMAAAIDSGMVTPDSTFFDAGPETISGLYVKNWYDIPKGPVTMTQCLQYSINVCMATLAKDLGPVTFYKYLDAFGIGHFSGIDMAGERIYPLNAVEDNNLSAHSFGQAMNVAPIQMMTAISAVANDGMIMAPRVVRSVISNGRQYDLPTKIISRPITPETAHTVTNMLAESLEKEAEVDIPGYRIAGKTGTAEISPHPEHPGYGVYSYRSDGYNASFVGWGPVDDPKFLVYVWLEEPVGIWGSVVAAPVFTEVVNELVVLMDIPPDDVRIQLVDDPMRLKHSVNTE
jgi:cell division protein FtsI/penicillin-binding protein 2